MAEVIGKVDAATVPFVGQGDLIIFSSTFANSKTYANAKLSDFASPQSLGQIVQDSTSWEGEDVSTDEILDEQGNIITAKVTAGTLSFSFDIASASANMMKKFMAATEIATANLGAPAFLDQSGLSAVGFGVDLPVFTAPIMVVDQEKKRAWVYPKAKITSNLSLSDGLYRIHAVVIAEQVDTDYLKTGMLVEGSLVYATA